MLCTYWVSMRESGRRNSFSSLEKEAEAGTTLLGQGIGSWIDSIILLPDKANIQLWLSETAKGRHLIGYKTTADFYLLLRVIQKVIPII